jgi:hypothetical protein
LLLLPGKASTYQRPSHNIELECLRKANQDMPKQPILGG